MKSLPTTERGLARLHEKLCAKRSRINDERIRLDNQIQEVCESRAFVKYGVRKGSVVECLDRNKQGVVVSFNAFHHCEHPPWLNVNLSDSSNVYGSTVTRFRVIES